MIKRLIHSAKIEKEIMLKVGLRTIDSHEVEEVDVLLDSGVTGLFIDCAWLHQKKNKEFNFNVFLTFYKYIMMK